jgi:hypothetical protein
VVKIGEPPYLEGIDADEPVGEPLLHVAVHALDDRNDGDEEGHADQYADQGEEALELLHPDRAERHANRFNQSHRGPWS